MNSPDLKLWQIEKLQVPVGWCQRYLGRLRKRMERRGFRGDDPLYQAVCSAYNAVHAVNVHLHYLEVDAWKRQRDRK